MGMTNEYQTITAGQIDGIDQSKSPSGGQFWRTSGSYLCTDLCILYTYLQKGFFQNSRH